MELDPGPGLFNLREFGGHATTDGRRVRTGLIYRSNSPLDPGEAGRAFFAGTGIRTALDLRDVHERDAEPLDLRGIPLEMHQVPILERKLEQPVDGPPTFGVLMQAMMDRCGARLAEAMGVIAGAERPTIVFCSNGKDRTGVLAAMVHDLLGVPDDTIAADFQETERRIPARIHEQMITRIVRVGVSREVAEGQIGAPAEVILDLLADTRERYDGTVGYLQHHGLPAERIDTLRAELLSEQ